MTFKEKITKLKESILTRLADTDVQEKSIQILEKWAKKMDIKLSPGTKIGQYPQTVVIDIRWHDNAIYVDSEGQIEVFGKNIKTFMDFNNIMNEKLGKKLDEDQGAIEDTIVTSSEKIKNIKENFEDKIMMMEEGTDYMIECDFDKKQQVDFVAELGSEQTGLVNVVQFKLIINNKDLFNENITTKQLKKLLERQLSIHQDDEIDIKNDIKKDDSRIIEGEITLWNELVQQHYEEKMKSIKEKKLKFKEGIVIPGINKTLNINSHIVTDKGTFGVRAINEEKKVASIMLPNGNYKEIPFSEIKDIKIINIPHKKEIIQDSTVNVKVNTKNKVEKLMKTIMEEISYFDFPLDIDVQLDQDSAVALVSDKNKTGAIILQLSEDNSKIDVFEQSDYTIQQKTLLATLILPEDTQNLDDKEIETSAQELSTIFYNLVMKMKQNLQQQIKESLDEDILKKEKSVVDWFATLSADEKTELNKYIQQKSGNMFDKYLKQHMHFKEFPDRLKAIIMSYYSNRYTESIKKLKEATKIKCISDMPSQKDMAAACKELKDNYAKILKYFEKQGYTKSAIALAFLKYKKEIADITNPDQKIKNQYR